MREPEAAILALFALFTATCNMALAENSVVPSIAISGTGRGSDGQYFAITRNYGILKKGDVIPISTDTESFSLKVTAIDERGLSFQKLDIEKNAVKPAPPEPKKTLYKYRDPFWPIGYTPQGSQLLQKDKEKK